MRNAKTSFAEEIAESIIAQIEAGTAPWMKSWDDSIGIPVNAVSGKAYRGINIMLLDMIANFKGYGDSRWLTYKQAQEVGGNVRRGEKGTSCVFWKLKEVEDAEAKDGVRKVPILNRFTLFNVDQCENLTLPEVEKRSEFHPIDDAEAVIKASRANIVHAGNQPCYVPSLDIIRIPAPENFKDTSWYYDALLHELGHWTGHESRLNRKFERETESYAREELRAEIASYMIAKRIGLPHHTEDHAAYVKAWVKALKKDPKEILRAASDAEKICDFLLGKIHAENHPNQ